MIVAGIDEAGYGPLLGPLVVGCCAFEIDADLDGPIPCVWKRLRKYVSKSRCKRGKRLHINDSKVVYSPAAGLKEIERSVLALSTVWGGWSDDLQALLGKLAPHALSDLPAYPWYDAAEEAFPHEADAMSLKLFCNALRLCMDENKAHCCHLGARVVLERQLNQMINATRNKASALFSTGAIHLDYLLKTYGERGLVILCDRQGGREHYSSMLRLMFDDWDHEITSEVDGRSEYRLIRNKHVVRLIFTEKAEAQCLPVAMASMISKYLREMLMHRFNRFWQRHMPELEPTAGYYTDGARFLQDIQAKRDELGIRDEELVRCR